MSITSVTYYYRAAQIWGETSSTSLLASTFTAACAAIGGLFGGIGAIPGAIIGGFIGGFGGGIGGSLATEKAFQHYKSR